MLARRASRAFHEYVPIAPVPRDHDGRIYRRIQYGPLLDVFVLDMRSSKDPNTDNLEPTSDGGVLGREQTAWLKRELRRSTATWKVIAADLPIGLLVPDGTEWEGIANGAPGKPLGREIDIAEVLSFLKHEGIRNHVWLTADVHYTAAHHYSPQRAAFTDFDPFWEFVSGPLNAGGFGPNDLDATFGPAGRLRAGAATGQRVPRRGRAVRRRGCDRLRHQGPDGQADRHHGHRVVDDNAARRQALTPIGSAGGSAGRSPVTQPGVRSPLARMMGRPMARTTASSVPTTRTWVRARVRAV